MKKLILYDHLGNKVGSHDVFVEGTDFEWEAPQPVAIWFGKILLVDEEPEEKTAEEIAEELQLEADKKREEVELRELEEASDKSGGGEGTSETEQPAEPETPLEIDTSRVAAKGDKRHRKSKTPEDTVGSRTKQRATGSSRDKTGGTTVGGNDERRCD